jgi:hypothetical protein
MGLFGPDGMTIAMRRCAATAIEDRDEKSVEDGYEKSRPWSPTRENFFSYTRSLSLGHREIVCAWLQSNHSNRKISTNYAHQIGGSCSFVACGIMGLFVFSQTIRVSSTVESTTSLYKPCHYHFIMWTPHIMIFILHSFLSVFEQAHRFSYFLSEIGVEIRDSLFSFSSFLSST